MQILTMYHLFAGNIMANTSCNAFNTLHLMVIVSLKRVYLKIPGIGERTYTTLLKTAQCADLSFILGICP